MFLQPECEAVIETVRNSLDEEVDVFFAYPYVKKPTKMAKPAIAVCPSFLDAKPVSLIGEGLCGEWGIEVNLFSPRSLSTESLLVLAEKTVNAVTVINPVKIHVSPLSDEEAIDCYKIKCTFTFSGIKAG